MSPTMAITNRPSLSFNWADDDDDDFDYESWKSTADISAPTIESLPSLQLPALRDEPSFITSCSVTESVTWTASKECRPSAPTHETTDWRCGKAVLSWRATAELPNLPAYSEMSGWTNGVISTGKRVNYALNWANMKAHGGYNCKLPVQFRGSRLRKVEFGEQKEVVEVKKTDTTIALEQNTLEKSVSESHGTKDAHDTSIVDSSTHHLVTPSNTAHSSPPTLDMSEPVHFTDEGYCSDSSPPISPTLSAREKFLDAPIDTTQVGISPVATFIEGSRRYGSQNTLKSDQEGDIILASRSELEDSINASPDLKHINQSSGILTCISSAAATGWFLLSQVPWTTVAIVTAGIVVGTAMHLARRH
jgi:hypothetical protein